MARLYHERQELRASLPPDRSADLDQARRQLRALEKDTADLHAGIGRWTGVAPGEAVRNLRQAALGYQRATEDLEAEGLGLGPAQGPPPVEGGIGSLRQRQAGLGAARPTLRRPAGDGPGPAHRPGGGVPAGPTGPRGLLGQAPRRPSSSGRVQPRHRARTGRFNAGRATDASCNESRLATSALGARRTPGSGSTCGAQPAALRHRPHAGCAGGPAAPSRDAAVVSLWPYRQVPPGCAQVADSGPRQKVMLGTATAPSHDAGYRNARLGPPTGCATAPMTRFQLGELGVIEARAFWLRQQKR